MNTLLDDKIMLPYNMMIITYTDTVIFMIYQIISAVGIIMSSAALIVFVKNHLNAMPHARTRWVK